jgi:DNA-binding NarL/FixJ family response regulator
MANPQVQVAPGVIVPPRVAEMLRRYPTAGTYKMTAFEMGISEQTVKIYASRLLRELGVDTLLQAYVRLGWLVIPDVPS